MATLANNGEGCLPSRPPEDEILFDDDQTLGAAYLKDPCWIDPIHFAFVSSVASRQRDTSLQSILKSSTRSQRDLSHLPRRHELFTYPDAFIVDEMLGPVRT